MTATDPNAVDLDAVRARVAAALNPLTDICGCPDRVAEVAVEAVLDALTAAGQGRIEWGVRLYWDGSAEDVWLTSEANARQALEVQRGNIANLPGWRVTRAELIRRVHMTGPVQHPTQEDQ